MCNNMNMLDIHCLWIFSSLGVDLVLKHVKNGTLMSQAAYSDNNILYTLMEVDNKKNLNFTPVGQKKKQMLLKGDS